MVGFRWRVSSPENELVEEVNLELGSHHGFRFHLSFQGCKRRSQQVIRLFSFVVGNFWYAMLLLSWIPPKLGTKKMCFFIDFLMMASWDKVEIWVKGDKTRHKERERDCWDLQWFASIINHQVTVFDHNVILPLFHYHIQMMWENMIAWSFRPIFLHFSVFETNGSAATATSPPRLQETSTVERDALMNNQEFKNENQQWS